MLWNQILALNDINFLRSPYFIPRAPLLSKKKKVILNSKINFNKIFFHFFILYFACIFFAGYAHSAFSPILYWILNHNSLRQSSCAPFLQVNAVQRFLRTHLRVTAPPPPPSSTNEAALGPFNPRYIKARPQQYRPPASSYNFYWNVLFCFFFS